MQYRYIMSSRSSHLADEATKPPVRADFDPPPKPEYHGPKVTSDTGLLTYSELAEVFDVTNTKGP